MKIARNITIDFEDLKKIDHKIKNGDFGGVSEFVQKAIKNELKRWYSMCKELNNLLKQAYYRYKDEKDPPIDPNDIKKFLLINGIDLEDENKIDVRKWKNAK